MNPFEASGVPYLDANHVERADKWRMPIALAFIVVGVVIGLIGLALVSNQFGNTDIYGIPILGLGGMLLATGVSRFFLKLRYSVLVGILAAPVSIVLLFVLFWAGVAVTILLNR